MIRRSTVLSLVLAVGTVLLPGLASATTLLVNQVNPYLGYGYGLSSWTTMSSELDNAFGSGNITVSNSPLANLASLLSYDRLWITARQPGDPGLSATEISNLQTFIATGRRVMITGENNSWTDWNNSFLSALGGSYSGTDTSVDLTPVLVSPLTVGVPLLHTIADGIALGGTPLFSQNVATLWGGSSNTLTLLSVNVIDDGTHNPVFDRNVAQWLAGGEQNPIPEPASLLLLGSGLLGLTRLRLRRRS